MAAPPARLSLMLQHAAGLADTAYEHLEACRSYITNELPLSESVAFSAANDLINAEHLLLRARQDLRSQLDIAAQQLRDEQIKFMLERSATGSVDEAARSGRASRLQENISKLPQILDHDAATMKESASDGQSCAATVVRCNDSGRRQRSLLAHACHE